MRKYSFTPIFTSYRTIDEFKKKMVNLNTYFPPGMENKFAANF